MQQITKTASLQHLCQRLSGSVWRASEQAPPPVRTQPSHHSKLDQCLPGGGWPLGAIIEILHDGPGCGELSLVAPALALQNTSQPIVLLKPPAIPNALAWHQWNIPLQRLWWIQPTKQGDLGWCAETVLRSRAFAALLAWMDPIDPPALRRLQACAQDSSTLIFLFRPQSAVTTQSPAPLRLSIQPDTTGIASIRFLKAKGPRPDQSIPLFLWTAQTNRLDTLDHVDRDTSPALAT